ncbi:MAG: hypothetical protein ACRD2S_11200 [Terriglobales bacterium]
MKYLLLAILLPALGFAQTATHTAASGSNPPGPPASYASTSVDQQDQKKAKALLDQMIQALGGNAYLNIQDVSQQGRTYSFHLGRPTSAGLLFWRFYKYPDKDRIELTKQRDVAEVFNGEKGAEITYKGIGPMDTKELTDHIRRQKYSLDVVLRKWLNEPDVALFYDGPTVADEQPVEKVTIMNAHDQALTIYIDSNTHLPVKKSFSWRDPTDKQRNVEQEGYDNYRPSDGIMTPFVVTRYYNGDMSNQRFLASVSYNKGMNDSMFNVGTTNLPSREASRK